LTVLEDVLKHRPHSHRSVIRYEVTAKPFGGTSMFKDEIGIAEFCILIDDSIVLRAVYHFSCKLIVETVGPITLDEFDQRRFFRAYKQAFRKARKALTVIA